MIYDVISLAETSARIDTAMESTRGAIQGYVSQHAAAERGGETADLFDALSTARTALHVARRASERLLAKHANKMGPSA